MLRCPSCGALHEQPATFCAACEMPLVIDSELAEEEAVGPRHELARKINPTYARGELVRVAYANHQAEAELIQGLLLEEGIPSLVKRSAGFDVPDMLAAGPRSIYVPQGGAEQAHLLLGEVDSTPIANAATIGGVSVPPRLIATILIVVLVVITLFSALVR